MLVDVHCHLDDPKIKDRLDEVVNDFSSAKVGKVIDVGCDKATSYLVRGQSEKYDEIFFAAGIHPMDVKNAEKGDICEIESLLSDKKCVAVGEVGLDYYWEKESKEIQKEYFVSQMELAKQYKLPLNIHVRDAMGDALELLKQNKDKLIYGGVMHCYNGSIETARELLKLGLYFSFGGTLTFKNARNIPEVMSLLPIDRILTETDSPYLAPEPKRGTCNEPKNIPLILTKISQVKNMDDRVIEEQIYKNAITLFPKLKRENET